MQGSQETDLSPPLNSISKVTILHPDVPVLMPMKSNYYFDKFNQGSMEDEDEAFSRPLPPSRPYVQLFSRVNHAAM